MAIRKMHIVTGEMYPFYEPLMSFSRYWPSVDVDEDTYQRWVSTFKAFSDLQKELMALSGDIMDGYFPYEYRGGDDGNQTG